MTTSPTVRILLLRLLPASHFTPRAASVAGMMNGDGSIPGPFPGPPNRAGCQEWSAAVRTLRSASERKNEFVNWEPSWNLPTTQFSGQTLDGTITSWNKGAEKILRLRRERSHRPTHLHSGSSRPPA